jgi:chromate transporter
MPAAGDMNTPPASPFSVFAIFTRLGLTSFGGPIAHLGYFREEFVVRRRWLDDRAFSDLVALCQFLPGPASSQAGFAIGLRRAGLPGGIAAFLGFTWPSAVALVLFAWLAGSFTGSLAAGVLHGLMLVAVAVIAQAVLGMARTACADVPHALVALGALVLVLLTGSALGQVAAIVAGALAGLVIGAAAMRPDMPAPLPWPDPVSHRTGIVLIAAVPAILVLLWLAVSAGIGGQIIASIEAYWRAGTLVFGGGHVVLPLLEQATVAPGWIGRDAFLAGYGAAQAVPGPLFTFAAYLGAVGPQPNGAAGAVIALLAIFLPGLLLVLGALRLWNALRAMPGARAALAGINAAVVGILAAALYDPVWTASVHTPLDFAIAFAAFLLLVVGRVPSWIVVCLTALAGLAVAAI